MDQLFADLKDTLNRKSRDSNRIGSGSITADKSENDSSSGNHDSSEVKIGISLVDSGRSADRFAFDSSMTSHPERLSRYGV